MKKIVLVFMIIFGIFIVSACEDSGGLAIKDPEPEVIERDVVREPTLDEIVANFKTNSPVNMLEAIKVKTAEMSNADVGLSDIIQYIKKIAEVYKDIPAKTKSEYKTVSELALLMSYPYADKSVGGPILIIKNAKLYKSSRDTNPQKVNIVLLNGTDMTEGQATGVKEDLFSAWGLGNQYLYDAYYAIYDNVDKNDSNTPLIIGGISLGGMVSQQLATLPAIKDYYNITNVVAVAAPIISPAEINYNKTTVARMVDTVDLVPQLSLFATKDSYQYIDVNGKQIENNFATIKKGPYKTFIGAHTFGYVEDSLWGNVDVLGYEKGGARFVFDLNSADINNKTTMTWYPAPTFNNAN